MQLIARLILVAVLAAFAVSSVAHAAGSAAMAADMVASDTAAMDMADCDACADPESGAMGISCDFVCGAGGFAAVLAQQCDAVALRPGAAPMSSVTRDFCGLSSPPAKEPPRILT
ncbi:hypothetical protein [Roseitranquillus sediminis]|uniref:hypothetical protein n=1 Tax=Roseitranquillus sediminis TaxID=2809051 RepID=UPI001D0C660F|nr:hypothetical protein [Roseitranquillus sediminis]MBM9595030.1 hypothetical protein [Roseitranquillus sediminis]